MSKEDETVKNAIRLIDEGWQQLQRDPKRNVIFVLGGTGAGKSTATEIVAGDLSTLHSVPNHKGRGLVIKDIRESEQEGRIGDPQIASKTFLPEYIVCNDDSNLVFIDCPGFNDNRGTHMDIAAMVLIKKIAEQVDHVRFVFVTPLSSVSYSNLQRNDFLQLCEHVTSFIKNLGKVENSMCLVVTKVNNFDMASGRQEGDDVIKTEVGRFLEEVAKHSSTSEENIQFVKCLLKDSSKWALIHYPEHEGPLSEMDRFRMVRQQILGICRDKLDCASVDRNDFAVTISSESKYIIRKRLIPFMKEEIERLVTELVEFLKNCYLEAVTGQLQTQQISNSVTCVKRLRENCENLKRQQIHFAENPGSLASKRVIEAAEFLQISLPKDQMMQLTEVQSKSKLFGEITEENDSEQEGSVQINNAFANLRSQLEDLYKEALETAREEINEKFQHCLESYAAVLEQSFFETFYSELNISSLAEKRQLLAVVHGELLQLKGEHNCIFAWVGDLFRIFEEQIPEAEQTRLNEYKELLDLYDEILGSPAARPIHTWMESFRPSEENIADFDKLYEFLAASKSMNSSGFADFDVNGIDADAIITNFLNAFKANSEILTIVQKTSGPKDKELMLELARYVISGKTKIFSGPEKVTVTGRHVKFTDFLNDDGMPPANNVVVLAAETVELDRNINGRGKELTVTVIGDKWIVKGEERKIGLEGSDAQNFQEKKAQSGRNHGDNGSDGMAGYSGGNGGNFFGVYREIVNSKNLLIFSNGGNGGDGQHGGDGYVGKDADERQLQLKDWRSYMNPVVFAVAAVSDIVNKQPKGGQGGNGGNGGAAGHPGAAGAVKLIGVCEVFDIGSICNSHGKPGSPGKAGRGGGAGKGGSSGNNGNDGSRRDEPISANLTGLHGRDVQEFRNYITQQIIGSEIGNSFVGLIDKNSGIPRN